MPLPAKPAATSPLAASEHTERCFLADSQPALSLRVRAVDLIQKIHHGLYLKPTQVRIKQGGV